jgi:hypothetical protein
MKEYYVLGLSGIIGVLFGTLYKYKPALPTKKAKEVPQMASFDMKEIQLDKAIFDQKEIQFIQQLMLGTKRGTNVSTMNLVAILELQNHSSYTKRVECNNFLKSLNLKILVKYGFKEAILTLGTDEDKRKKCYQVDSHFLHQLHENQA